MSERRLIIEGARQNNLKNINLSLPHNRVIAITGVSGSGKSSLAFDTIFAEGQWRFIESLSTYARLFLEKLDRPDVDAIHNLRPAIALEQKNPVRGSRSTVGTLTELYDLFRLLYSRIATPFCPDCGREIRMWNTSEVVSELIERHKGMKALVVFETKDQTDELKKRGFYRAWLDGEVVDFDELTRRLKPAATPFPSSHLPLPISPLDIVLDRLVVKDEPRLADSIEMAWREGKGKIKVVIIGKQNTEHPLPHPPPSRGRAGVEGEAMVSEGIITRRFSSKNACDYCKTELPQPYPLLFSFNHPVGACPDCKGFGNILQYDEDLIVPDRSLSLSQGTVDPWNKPAYRWWRQQLLKGAHKDGLDINKPYADFTEKEKGVLFKGSRNFYGIDNFFEDMESRRYKLHIRVFLSRYRRPVTCSRCKGKRLRDESLAYKLSGLDIAELSGMPIADIIRFFKDPGITPFQADMTKEIRRQIDMKLGFLRRVGLDYLSLNRDGRTLSGGEYQRVNLSNQLASFLTGTLYVLDEPTIGLHARDVDIIADIMSELSDMGNTILVVEHDRSVIQSADWIVELGPGGGQKGGEIVFSGERGEFLKKNTLTARYIRGIESVRPPSAQKPGTGKELLLHNATGNNLKSVDLRIPLGAMVAVTGVSGSGKSSLVVETLYRALARQFKVENVFPLPYESMEGDQLLMGVRLIDQAPIGRNPRSNPVTYLKIFDIIRKLFSEQTEAKAYGYGPGFFSFNVPGGRCESCKGAGYQKLEMYFFEDLYIKCEECRGEKYRPEALRVTYRGRNINDVLNMTVTEAIDFFHDIPKIKNRLLITEETGLGYLRLGQPATTLSGGEAQRLKICAEIINSPSVTFAKKERENMNKGILYILDEPTTGLHFRDVKALLEILQRLVSTGNTVLVIEHNLDVIMASDRVVDLGPEGGEQGGSIVFEGTPEDIVYSEDSHTGKSLRDYLEYLAVERSDK